MFFWRESNGKKVYTKMAHPTASRGCQVLAPAAVPQTVAPAAVAPQGTAPPALPSWVLHDAGLLRGEEVAVRHGGHAALGVLGWRRGNGPP